MGLGSFVQITTTKMVPGLIESIVVSFIAFMVGMFIGATTPIVVWKLGQRMYNILKKRRRMNDG